VKIHPGHYGCVHNIGCCYFSTRKYVNAKKWFILAAQVDPERPDAHYGLSATCLKLGEFDEALTHIRKIDKLG
jgi:tetratricopeptide (TPR) repeat protein